MGESGLEPKNSSFMNRLRGGDEEFDKIVDKRDNSNSLSTFEAGVLIFKAALHGSFLLLPWAHSNFGHATGFIGLFVLYLTVFGAIRLLTNMAHVLTKRTGVAQLRYGDVAEETFLSRYTDAEGGAYGFRIFVDTFVFLSLFFTACLYIVETANGLKRSFSDECITVWLLALLIGILLILLAFINHLKWLVPLCLIGCICIILGAIFACVVFYSHTEKKQKDDAAIVSDANRWPSYLGSVPFIVTWIYVVLPVERKSRQPLEIVEAYCSPWTMMFIFIFVTHSLVGFLGYDVIGPNAYPNPLSQFDHTEDPYTKMSFYLISIGVFLTINLLILVASKIVWYYVRNHISENYHITMNILLAPMIMVICIMLAIALMSVNVVLSVLATFFVGIVSFIFPPVMNFLMDPDVNETLFGKIWRYTRNILILSIGTLVIFCGFPTDFKLWNTNRKLGGYYMDH